MNNFMVLSPMRVSTKKLTIGNFYFSVCYLDDECVVPEIESLIYIGRNLGGEQDGSLYFQDAQSFVRVGAFPNTSSADVRVTVTGTEPPPNLFELDGMVDELTRCLLRRGAK